MKAAPAALIAYLQANTQFVMADLYTITLLSGAVLTYTTAQQSVTVPQPGGMAITWVAGDVLMSGDKLSTRIGVDVDEQTITVAYKPTSDAGGQPWPQAVLLGLFDGADFRRDRVVLPAWGGVPIGNGDTLPGGGTSDGRVNMFTGKISTAEKVGRVSAEIKVKSGLVALDIDMPRNLWAPACLNTLYDGLCGLVKADFAAHGVVGAGPSVSVLPWASATADIYSQGTLTFESGANIGVSRTVKLSNGSALTLAYPLQYLPSEGDQFVVYQGCNKTIARCTALGNFLHFRGFPFVPPPYTQY